MSTLPRVFSVADGRAELRVVDGRAHQDLNLQFLDTLLTRLESLIDARTYARYADSGTGEEAARYRAAVEPRLAHAKALAERLDQIREQAEELSFEFPLDRLRARYSLDYHEMDILQLALAPTLDASFRKRCARYKDNILLDYVDVDLACSLLFDSRVERLRAREYFASDAPLIAHKLLTLGVPREASTTALLGNELRVPNRVVNYALGRETLDTRIAELATLSSPTVPFDHFVFEEYVRTEILQIVTHHATTGRPEHTYALPGQRAALIMQFYGLPGTGKTLAVKAIASHLNRKLIVVDCGKVSASEIPFRQLIDDVFLEAKVHEAVLCFDHCEAIFGQHNPRLPALYSQFEDFDGLILLTTNDGKALDHSLERWVAYSLKFELPRPAERQRIWELLLPEAGPLAADVDTQDLGSTFEITGAAIHNAVQLAAKRSLAVPDGDRVIDMKLLMASAQAQMRADMEDYSVKSRMTLTLKDIVLPDDERKQVEEILAAAKARTFVMNKWGFGKRLTTGKGLVMLFAGEPGTGKTLCAEILAAEMGLSLFQVSIPKIVSKYIGETEKNIAKVFGAARASRSMLLFDEADALFTKRVKVERSVDRFSNMEVNMLLQEIERFEGLVVLTTNEDKHIDKAFQRRINFKIRFPFPDKAGRADIWRVLWPPECPRDGTIDLDDLGESFELSGGYIKNAILRAAYRAASAGEPINFEHVKFAAEQECKSAGKIFRMPGTYDDF